MYHSSDFISHDDIEFWKKWTELKEELQMWHNVFTNVTACTIIYNCILWRLNLKE
jgi:hypothetical protein